MFKPASAFALCLLGLWGLVAHALPAVSPPPAPAAVQVRAAALTARDEKNIRAVVQGQLDALARDDADKAFSFAAPNVREALDTAPRFMDMVQRGYPVVYRPASVAYLKAEGSRGAAIQRVQMTDQAGEAWLATYTLQRQKSGAWRITGCSVTDNRGRMT
ncbi:MAG: hypothetical protein B7X59_10175 [Polaromonas sp. 39-63-203]|jgi:hypothetical protein|uniref:DUF4864 domain-containing protein n=1 Tax=Polaromonas sp. TaxID=1869339 RepID=UPI000BC8DB62|nr:DUF4864 domain-containing protein [Polaromonas sp.]OYY51163.1 MAG: hypothetical protein B7Y54_11250 [Polaromonas sp. 35-63-240]OYY96419.1 MAG: hypothetical protein B7Y42_09250 [Polaromonas sp. 28-63-22]OYZ82101.1 MAG: hypothetical protein B7Y03_11525 [Polaromonas sp. 24-62-144]OZA96257.1 MAG: hypothetical protein B7X59_10175 [Polaromonas sp. 39-63-203]HQS30974.1 DUF4864 domain-containing protein [Polaromonas sp.]